MLILLTSSIQTSLKAAVVESIRVVAVTGDPAPDGNGYLRRNFSAPVINEAGQVAFSVVLEGTSGGSEDDSGIYRFDPTGLMQIARTGQAPPEGNGKFSDLDLPTMNDSGQVAFYAFLHPTAGGISDGRAIYRTTGNALSLIARNGQSAAGDGLFDTLRYEYHPPSLNNAGQVAFWSMISGSTSDFGVFRGDSTTLVAVAREGRTGPDGSGPLGVTQYQQINESGQVAFSARISNTSVDGIYRGDLVGGARIVRTGDLAPALGTTFTTLGLAVAALNDNGYVAFPASLAGTPGGINDDEGLFIGNGKLMRGARSSATQIVREGERTPNNDGYFYSFAGFNTSPALEINNENQVAFRAIAIKDGGGSYDALFRWNAGALTEIAREGNPAPDGNGNLYELTQYPAFNNHGQLAFLGTLEETQGGNTDNQGLFFFDDALGLLQVARAGDELLGSMIIYLQFSGGYLGGKRSGFNDGGDVAFSFGLADGRYGVAVWSVVPEPGRGMILVVGSLVIGGVRVRRGQGRAADFADERR